MSEISLYLNALRQALTGSDPALIQDALAETETRFRIDKERLAWSEPLLSSQEAVRRVVEGLGPAEARAETYRQRERMVAEALGPVPRATAPGGTEGGPAGSTEFAQAPHPPRAMPGPSPYQEAWPTFFGVFLEPKAYTSLVYMLVSLVTGILYFTWAVTGLGLSMGFIILIIGIPMVVFYLGSIRALGLGEGRLVEALLDVRMPRRPPLLPEGHSWLERLTGLFVDPYTWKCLAYLLLHLPLGILFFTLTVMGLSLSLSLIAAPFAHWLWQVPICVFHDEEQILPMWLLVLMPVGGALGLTGTLHMALGLGRIQGGLARRLLVTGWKGTTDSI